MQDYHRWHTPVTGRELRREAIDGALYTVNPVAIRQQVNVYTENKRVVSGEGCAGPRTCVQLVRARACGPSRVVHVCGAFAGEPV
jgi:phosphatidylserine decarboxylase